MWKPKSVRVPLKLYPERYKKIVGRMQPRIYIDLSGDQHNEFKT